MTRGAFQRLANQHPKLKQTFSMTRRGLYFLGSPSWFGGYWVYQEGQPIIDQCIYLLRQRDAKVKVMESDSMLNQLTYTITYATPEVSLVIRGGNCFQGGKGAWLVGSGGAELALTLLGIHVESD
jgi:hypothetical protein